MAERRIEKQHNEYSFERVLLSFYRYSGVTPQYIYEKRLIFHLRESANNNSVHLISMRENHGGKDRDPCISSTKMIKTPIRK